MKLVPCESNPYFLVREQERTTSRREMVTLWLGGAFFGTGRYGITLKSTLYDKRVRLTIDLRHTHWPIIVLATLNSNRRKEMLDWLKAYHK